MRQPVAIIYERIVSLVHNKREDLGMSRLISDWDKTRAQPAWLAREPAIQHVNFPLTNETVSW